MELPAAGSESHRFPVRHRPPAAKDTRRTQTATGSRWALAPPAVTGRLAGVRRSPGQEWGGDAVLGGPSFRLGSGYRHQQFVRLGPSLGLVFFFLEQIHLGWMSHAKSSGPHLGSAFREGWAFLFSTRASLIHGPSLQCAGGPYFFQPSYLLRSGEAATAVGGHDLFSDQ